MLHTTVLTVLCVFCISSVTGIEGDDEAVLNMVMHSLGSLRPPNTLTGSVATEPKAEDYPPEGLMPLFLPSNLVCQICIHM